MANEYVKQPIKQKEYPLNLEVCSECHHVQLDRVVDRSLFKDYRYTSGYRDWKPYADTLRGYRSICDIGCNDGGFLKEFPDYLRIGIDPSDLGAEKHCRFYQGFLDVPMAEKIVSKYGRMDVATANNVFAHLEDIDAFMNAVEILTDRFVIECSDLKKILALGLFDTIYHEHVDYFSQGALADYFQDRGWLVEHMVYTDDQGGSFRMYVKRNGRNHQCDLLPNGLLEKFPEKVANLTERIGNELAEKNFIGFGCPAKATTMMYQTGIRPEFFMDDNPLKQGMYSPGLHVPIYRSVANSKNAQPEYLKVLFAWNLPHLAHSGWFVPLPEPRWIS